MFAKTERPSPDSAIQAPRAEVSKAACAAAIWAELVQPPAALEVRQAVVDDRSTSRMFVPQLHVPLSSRVLITCVAPVQRRLARLEGSLPSSR
jgi:hypothetical protein